MKAPWCHIYLHKIQLDMKSENYNIIIPHTKDVKLPRRIFDALTMSLASPYK
jgi:hypothetical protein